MNLLFFYEAAQFWGFFMGGWGCRLHFNPDGIPCAPRNHWPFLMSDMKDKSTILISFSLSVVMSLLLKDSSV